MALVGGKIQIRTIYHLQIYNIRIYILKRLHDLVCLVDNNLYEHRGLIYLLALHNIVDK